MKPVRLILFITALFEIMGVCPAFSQDKYELNFREITGIYGKPLGKIRNITQDPYGYMWFSAEDEKCIYKYDGIRRSLYRKDNFNPNSLGGVNINALHADQTGLIWVGFAGDGLDAFSPATNNFTHYRHDDRNQKSLASDNVNVLLRDSRGRLWVGTDRGLDQLNVETGEFIHYKRVSGNNRSLSHDFVINIYEDRRGVIWIATAGYSWIVPNPEEGGLNRFEENGTFTQYKHDPKDEHSLISNKVLALYEDSRGIFWVGTAGNGLHTMDRKTGRFERHLFDPAHPQKLSRPRLKSDPFCKALDVITFIVEDHSGAIWIGSMCSGLNRYDPNTETVVSYENSNGFPESTTWNGFVSRDGVLWISTQNPKSYRVNPVRNVVEKKNLGLAISRFLQNNDGTVWAGYDSGLLLLGKSGEVLQKVRMNDQHGNPIRATEIHRDSTDMLWLGTGQGVYVMDTRSKKYHLLDFGFYGGVTIKIADDNKNPDIKWITTIDGGLVKYSRRHGVLKRFIHNKNDPSSIAGNHLTYVLDNDSSVWVATADGVSKLDKKTDKFTNYLPS